MDENLPKNFSSLLEEIRKRPTLYLPRYSIFDLQAFYDGYSLALDRCGYSNDETDETEFSEFLNWIREICPVKTNHAWANLLFFHASDERDALDKFFGLLDDFREMKSYKMADEATDDSDTE